jgi:hypothetical protein
MSGYQQPGGSGFPRLPSPQPQTNGQMNILLTHSSVPGTTFSISPAHYQSLLQQQQAQAQQGGQVQLAPFGQLQGQQMVMQMNQQYQQQMQQQIQYQPQFSQNPQQVQMVSVMNEDFQEEPKKKGTGKIFHCSSCDRIFTR